MYEEEEKKKIKPKEAKCRELKGKRSIYEVKKSEREGGNNQENFY